MWAYLSTWVVQDGELPELRRGSILSNYGIRASGQRIDEPSDDGLELITQPAHNRPEEFRYRLGGTINWARPDTSEWVIRSGASSFIALLGGWRLPLASVGDPVTLSCSLSVIPEYEWESFALPDVRRDWRVEALKVSHRPIDWSRGGEGRPGDVIDVVDINEMHRWDDERPGHSSTYVLDLRPIP